MFLKNTLLIFMISLIFSCKSNQIAKNTADCVNPKKINPDVMCNAQYEPVCGCDDKTYSNACEAEKAGLNTWKKGECPK